jgi:hypothetical protein
MQSFIKSAVAFGAACVLASVSFAEDPPKTQIEAPAEPNAIALDTGGVEGQTAKETWY